ncbi:hypothetical protein JWG39_15415 [Desulforhopalus vacuolatus]|uniref:hypothetical protein n=1 Tax=Desulforhopalus vacuolatus TaxID=40414 RepID=UPI001963CBC8|nr:hypothetical protein [Desulforhopalus vacuolatus]MBM9521208.1 hypothetical protein [Desulforhopalus vacuolatus]
MDFIWQVQYEITPSLQQSEKVDGINFEVINSKTYVTTEHLTDNYDDISKTVCREDMKTLRDYMLRRMVYQKTYQQIIVLLKEQPFLKNRDELKEKGAKLTRTLRTCFVMSFSLLEVNDEISLSECFWKNGFTGKNAGLESDILRIASWIEKSEAEQDSIQKFILTWISFNSLYGLYSRKISNRIFYNEVPQFTDTVTGLLSNDEAKKIYDRYRKEIGCLAIQNLQLRNGTNFSNDLALELKRNQYDYKSIIIRALECIYCIRNECFHNGPQLVNFSEYLNGSREVLFLVIANCLKNFVTHN